MRVTEIRFADFWIKNECFAAILNENFGVHKFSTTLLEVPRVENLKIHQGLREIQPFQKVFHYFWCTLYTHYVARMCDAHNHSIYSPGLRTSFVLVTSGVVCLNLLHRWCAVIVSFHLSVPCCHLPSTSCCFTLTSRRGCTHFASVNVAWSQDRIWSMFGQTADILEGAIYRRRIRRVVRCLEGSHLHAALVSMLLIFGSPPRW